VLREEGLKTHKNDDRQRERTLEVHLPVGVHVRQKEVAVWDERFHEVGRGGVDPSEEHSPKGDVHEVQCDDEMDGTDLEDWRRSFELERELKRVGSELF